MVEQTNEESVAEEANPIKELEKEASNHKEPYIVLETIDSIEDENKALEESEVKEVVDLERQLMCALDENKKLKEKNALLEESKRENAEDHEETIVGLKTQVEEANRIAEVLTSQLQEK